MTMTKEAAIQIQIETDDYNYYTDYSKQSDCNDYNNYNDTPDDNGLAAAVNMTV